MCDAFLVIIYNKIGVPMKFAYLLKLTLLLLFLGCTNQILYMPQEPTRAINHTYPYTQQTLLTEDGEKLSAITYSTTPHNRDVVLFLYGNADNLNNCSSLSELFLPQGYDFFAIDYRGYGDSTGSPSPKGLSIDINTTINYLTQWFDNIFIYAQSIGAVSLLGTLDHLNQRKIRAIITEGAFYSYKELSTEFLGIKLPWIDYDKLEHYAPSSSSGNSTIPLLLIHSEEDDLISYKQGLSLANHFKNATHKKIKGKHLGFLSNYDHFKEVFEFFEKSRH